MANWNNHESSEAEALRRTVISQEETIKILQENVKQLQAQLQNSYIRISQLKEQRYDRNY